MSCPNCGHALQALFTSQQCPNGCKGGNLWWAIRQLRVGRQLSISQCGCPAPQGSCAGLRVGSWNPATNQIVQVGGWPTLKSRDLDQYQKDYGHADPHTWAVV